MVLAMINDLESENTTLQKEFKTFTKTYEGIEEGPAKDLEKTVVNTEKKTREWDAPKVRVAELEKVLEALCNAPKANAKKIEGPELKVASDAKGIAHLVMLVKDYRSNCFQMTANNG